jgi:two-component sensor histidine kinase
MPTSNIDILAEINSISKIHTLKRDDIDAIMTEFADRITHTLHIERLNVWIFSPEKDSITSMGEYDKLTQTFSKGTVILKKDCPVYFNSLEENEILIAPNVYENSVTKELVDPYFRKYNVISLMDVPMRIGGNLIGVICYEHVGEVERVFSEKDKLFALSVGFVFASNLEARQRRVVQHLLDEELKEKTVLIQEINHRVKNNIAVISSLLNMQVSKSKDKYHKLLFEECKNKIDAIASIHRITYKSKNYDQVNIQEFVEELIQDLLEFYKTDSQSIIIAQEIESIFVPLDIATPLALIINEVITNSYKHAFPDKKEGVILLNVFTSGNDIKLEIIDNGVGFNNEDIREGSLGIDIINGLAEQLNGRVKFENDNGTKFTLTLPK